MSIERERALYRAGKPLATNRPESSGDDTIGDAISAETIRAAPAVAGVFNLLHEIDELRSSVSYTTGGHAARTLIRLASLRVVLFVLRRQTEFEQHHTAQPITLQVLVGRIRLTLAEQLIEQAAGEMLLFEPNLRYDLSAMIDSAFLLSMPWSERVAA